jgi:hypothetical protein
MFWEWNSGYIFLKLEGTAPASASLGNSITYHIGGYKGAYQAQRKVNVDFAQHSATVSAVTQPTISLNVNVNALFSKPNKIDFRTFSYQMSPGPGARMIADNYAELIKLDKIIN